MELWSPCRFPQHRPWWPRRIQQWREEWGCQNSKFTKVLNACAWSFPQAASIDGLTTCATQLTLSEMKDFVHKRWLSPETTGDAGDRFCQRLPVQFTSSSPLALRVRNTIGRVVRGEWTGIFCLMQSENKIIGKSHGDSGPAAHHLLPLVYTKVRVSWWETISVSLTSTTGGSPWQRLRELGSAWAAEFILFCCCFFF